MMAFIDIYFMDTSGCKSIPDMPMKPWLSIMEYIRFDLKSIA